MPKLTKKLVSSDVPSKISFTRKGALHLPNAACTFQNLAGTLHLQMGDLIILYFIRDHLLTGLINKLPMVMCTYLRL